MHGRPSASGLNGGEECETGIDKDNKEFRDAEVFNLWLANHTQEEIADAVGMTQQAIAKILQPIPIFEFVVKAGELSEIEDEDERLAAMNNETDRSRH